DRVTGATKGPSREAPPPHYGGTMRIKFFAVAVALIAMTATAWAQTGQVEVKDAWARATPAGATVAAAYLTLVAPAGDRLVSVATPAAKQADLHMMSTDNGVMKMRPLPAGIDPPAGTAVTLKPGCMHLMMSPLTGPRKEGDSLPLTLPFAKSGSREIT